MYDISTDRLGNSVLQDPLLVNYGDFGRGGKAAILREI